MLLLKLLLFLSRLHLVKLAAGSFVPLVFLPHGEMFVQHFNTPLDGDNLPTKGIVIFVHGGHFFIKLLHGSNVVAVQKIEQGSAFFQVPYLPIPGAGFPL